MILDWRLAGGYTYVVVQIQPQWWEAGVGALRVIAARGRMFCGFSIRSWEGHHVMRSGDSDTKTLLYYETSQGARQAAERYLIRAGLMTRDGQPCDDAIQAYVAGRLSSL